MKRSSDVIWIFDAEVCWNVIVRLDRQHRVALPNLFSLWQFQLHLTDSAWGEKSEDCRVPEDLFTGLKVTDPQEAECVNPPVSSGKEHHSQSELLKDVDAQPQHCGEEECFHDASASFETEELGAEKIENKPEDDMNSSEEDEEYLMELRRTCQMKRKR